MANQYPSVSNENRQLAKHRGDKTYTSGTPCKLCGSYEKYVSSMGCVPCNIARNRPKLDVLIAARKAPAYNPEKRRRNLLRHGYNISVPQYEALLAEQHGCCAICGTDACATGRHFAVDHDHTTGRIRGLLCVNCNQGIGKFKEQTDIMKRAIEYLTRERL